MNSNSVIRVIRMPEVSDLAGEKVMVDFEQGKYFLLKGVGNDIWDMIKDGISVGEIVSALLKEYEVSEEECTQETINFLDKLVEMNMIKAE